MSRMIDLNTTTYWWVAGAATVTSTAISAALLTNARNISTYVHASTSINPSKSDVVNEKSITDVANVNIPTIGNYDGNLVLIRDWTSSAPSSTDPLTTIGKAAGIVGWIIRRDGYASTVAAAASQLVDAFLFVTDAPTKSGGSGTGFHKATIPLLSYGSFVIDGALAA